MQPSSLAETLRAAAVWAAVLVAGGCAPPAPGAEPPDGAVARSSRAAGAAVIPGLTGRLAARGYRVGALHADGRGRLHLVVEGDENRHAYAERLYYAVREGGRWSAPVPLSETPGLSHGARIVSGGDGRVHVLWYEHRGGAPARLATDVLVRTRGARGWTPPVSLYHAAAGFEPAPMAVGTDADGQVQVLHATRDRGLGRLVLARGRWWPAGFTDDGGFAPHWVQSAGGAAFAYVAVVPRPHRVGRSDVYLRSAHAMGWGEPLPVHTDEAEFSHHPQVVVDGGGRWHAAWLEGRAGQVLPSRLLYASSADGRTWSAPVDLTPPGAPSAEVYSARLAADRRNRIHLTFTQAREGIGDHALFYLRRDAGGWTAPARLFPALGYAGPVLETAQEGDRLHLAWKDARSRYRHAVLDLSAAAPERTRGRDLPR